MRYVIGAAIGAVLALLLGVPAFNTDRDSQSEPPLFSTYCDLEAMAREWADECIPSGGGIAFMVLAGAGVGALAAAAFHRRRSTEESESGDEGSPGARSELTPDAGAAERRRQERDRARDEVILEAALEISAAVERKRDSSVHQTIQRKFATSFLSDDVRERGTRLSIINLAGTAVERALELGWLRSQGSGPDEVLARTSIPLQVAGDSDEDVSQSGEPVEDADASTDQAPTRRSDPDSLEELESLIRLHERGVLTDVELKAAKARLLSGDEG